MDTSTKSGSAESSIDRALRRMRTMQEKLAIVEAATQPGASVALVARKHGVNANLVFGWMRLHRCGLLQEQCHGKTVPLLPVKVSTPTLTPTERANALAKSKRRRPSDGDAACEAMLELVLPDGLSSFRVRAP